MITKIGKYNIRKRLGEGGFGEVYLADDDSIGRLVAIKVFKPKDENVVSLATSATSEGLENLRQRFINEAKILASLEHEDAVVNIIEFGVLPDGAPWYSMPYLPKSLSELLGKDVFDKRALEELDTSDHPKALPLNQCLEILEQILQGLSAAHEKGLIHRDIKPANILLADNGKIRIADFGIAKAPDSGNSTVSQLGMGSRNYMAPEQRESAKHVDARADVYSLGVFAYRMLTGLLPKGRFADPNVHVPALSDDFNALILKAMQEDADDRYENAQTMLQSFTRAKLKAASASNNTEQSEHTGTWIGASDAQIKAELKPLEQKIIALLQSQGEVKDSDMPVLNALADLGNLSNGELTALIQQIAESQNQSSPEQKAFQQWVQTLNAKQANGGSLSDEALSALVAAGVISTGKTKEALEAIIQAKHATPQAQRHKETVADETQVRSEKPSKSSSRESSSKKTAIALGLFIALSAGSYFAYDYYQSEQLRIAQEAKNKQQAKQQRIAKAAEEKTQAEQVTQAQQYLNKLGFVLSETGQFDTRTKSAIEVFEQSRNLLVTGEVDSALLTALESALIEKEDAAWAQAKKINSSKSYTDFLAAHANSRYETQATEAKQNTLNREASAQAKSAAIKFDNVAWDKAKRANTISAYQAYLSAQSQGQYRASAQQRINEINIENSKVALTINTTPADATVQILNIEPSYQRGIQLEMGQYNIRVSKTGYVTQNHTISLSSQQSSFSYNLESEQPQDSTFRVSGQTYTMKAIPAGSFMMGCSPEDYECQDGERPRHRVTIESFTLMETEVTWAMYQPCIDAGACPNNDSDDGDNGWGKGNRPVINVSHYDITTHFIPWLNKTTGQTFRLPSEAEWEYAARGNTTTKYSWGNAISCDQARYGRRENGECSNSKDGTVPVKSFSPNPYGLFDMHGNVWELTADCKNETYAGAPNDGRAWAQGDCSRRVTRGGSWDLYPLYLRTSSRFWFEATTRFLTIGFRLAQDETISPKNQNSSVSNNLERDEAALIVADINRLLSKPSLGNKEDSFSLAVSTRQLFTLYKELYTQQGMPDASVKAKKDTFSTFEQHPKFAFHYYDIELFFTELNANQIHAEMETTDAMKRLSKLFKNANAPSRPSQ
ncbi:MAG: serine/threonine-protein kinase [Alphaproteobacteria bacterium]|jgi:serine/threonine-protein kinase